MHLILGRARGHTSKTCRGAGDLVATSCPPPAGSPHPSQAQSCAASCCSDQRHGR